ncbi:MAG: MFS transporter [Chloroflexota bacterium]
MDRAPRLLLTAMLIDTVGSGLFIPFELLFGHVVVGLSLAEVGLGISIGSGAAIAVGPMAGARVDGVGATRVMGGANVASAIGCLALLVVHALVPFILVSFVLAAAQRTFWAAYAPVVADFVGGDELETWFGRFRGIRFAGIAAGAAAASGALLLGQEVGLRIVLTLDAFSYVAAMALLLMAVRARDQRPTPGPIESDPGRSPEIQVGYLPALRDGTNVLLAVANVAATLIIITPLLALPVFVLDGLGLPAWLPGLLAAIATLSTAVPSLLSGRITRGHPRLELLAVAAVFWAAGSLLFAASAWTPAWWLILLPAAMVAFGFGEALYAPTADALPLALAPIGLAGRYTAIHQLAWGISETIAPTLAVVLLLSGPGALWLTLAVASVVLATAYVGLQRRVGGRVGIAGASVWP